MKTPPTVSLGAYLSAIRPWPKRLPRTERKKVESFAEAFTRAIAKETTLSPDKLSLADYKRRVQRLGPTDPGGEALTGTPWADAWHQAGRSTRPTQKST